MERVGCIYRYHKDGMSYIGQTIELDRRRYAHKMARCNNPFHNSVRKHGIDSFGFEILEDNIPESKLDKHERFWIIRFNSLHPNGYNLREGGSRPSFSEESKRKMSEAHIGMKYSKETRHKLSESKKGKKHSLETKCKIGESNKEAYKRKRSNPTYQNKIEVLRRRAIRLIAKGWSQTKASKHLEISRWMVRRFIGLV